MFYDPSLGHAALTSHSRVTLLLRHPRCLELPESGGEDRSLNGPVIFLLIYRDPRDGEGALVPFFGMRVTSLIYQFGRNSTIQFVLTIGCDESSNNFPPIVRSGDETYFKFETPDFD